jgi:hypothetical protein
MKSVDAASLASADRRRSWQQVGTQKGTRRPLRASRKALTALQDVRSFAVQRNERVGNATPPWSSTQREPVAGHAGCPRRPKLSAIASRRSWRTSSTS